MSTKRPTGFDCIDAMRRREARRRARAVAFFTDYVGKEVRIDRHTAVDSIAAMARERPWAVSASVLRRVAEQARNERFTTPRRPERL
jgi:hypothetical protein